MRIPQDFLSHDRSSPVTDPWQPLFSRWTDAACEIGFILAKQHCNARDTLHGGVIASLSANAMGLSLAKAWMRGAKTEAKPGIITTNLNIDYFKIATIGAWICIAPKVVHIGTKTGTVEARILADDTIIARANATFRIIT